MSPVIPPTTSHVFRDNSVKALGNAQLQRALDNIKRDFVDFRGRAVGELPEYDALKAEAKALKDHTLANLDFYLERFEQKVVDHIVSKANVSEKAVTREELQALVQDEDEHDHDHDHAQHDHDHDHDHAHHDHDHDHHDHDHDHDHDHHHHDHDHGHHHHEHDHAHHDHAHAPQHQAPVRRTAQRKGKKGE